MKGKTIFSRRLQAVGNRYCWICLETFDVRCNLKQFDGLPRLTLTPIFYDRISTPLRVRLPCVKWESEWRESRATVEVQSHGVLLQLYNHRFMVAPSSLYVPCPLLPVKIDEQRSPLLSCLLRVTYYIIIITITVINVFICLYNRRRLFWLIFGCKTVRSDAWVRVVGYFSVVKSLMWPGSGCAMLVRKRRPITAAWR